MRTPETQSIQVNGLKIHVRRWAGTEPSLIALHGFMDTGATFFELANALPNQMLAWDARGFGQSEQIPRSGTYHFFDYLADLDEWLSREVPGPVILIGHSMGGMIASLYAGCRPDKVKGLINLEGWMVPDSDPCQTPERVTRWLDSRREASAFRDLADLTAAVARLQAQDPRLSAAQASYLAQAALASQPDGSLRFCHDPRHRSPSPQPFRLDQALAFWRQITAPSLLVYGAQSPIRQLPDWDLRIQAFQTARLVEIAEASHNLHLHQPQSVAELIQTWLETSVSP